MLGFLHLTESALPVESIRRTHPQAYPQVDPVFVQSISRRTPKPMPISWGRYLGTNLPFFRLLHSERHLSTENRELSTNRVLQERKWGDTLPPNMAGIFDDKSRSLDN